MNKLLAALFALAFVALPACAVDAATPDDDSAATLTPAEETNETTEALSSGGVITGPGLGGPTPSPCTRLCPAKVCGPEEPCREPDGLCFFYCRTVYVCC